MRPQTARFSVHGDEQFPLRHSRYKVSATDRAVVGVLPERRAPDGAGFGTGLPELARSIPTRRSAGAGRRARCGEHGFRRRAAFGAARRILPGFGAELLVRSVD